MKMRCTSALAAMLLALLGSGSPAAVAAPQAMYEPGSANAFKPVYDSSLGGYKFKCSYAGWVSVRVNWTCDLTAPALGLTLSHKSGSFSGGDYNPGWWFYPKSYGVTTVCTVAYATYADGSAYDNDRKCT
jgi:hypothetical protein